MDGLKRIGVKSFDELTITDDFMFGGVMGDPKNLRPMIEYILGVKIAQGSSIRNVKKRSKPTPTVRA